jgi:hypothetical protein
MFRWSNAPVLALGMASIGCSQLTHKSPLARAAGYLWAQQETDGGWHSHTYGLLRSGQSLTPFVLEGLLQIPEEVTARPSDRVERAIAFIRRNTNRDGAIGMMDPEIPDYPNYATALAVSALCRAKRPGWEDAIRPMIVYLRKQQFTEQNGWHREDAPYGAWGMGGETRTPPNPGHVDLSMTRHVIDALRAAGVHTDDQVFDRARVFVERCQNLDRDRPAVDGGFFFSTTEFDTNKAGHDGTRFRSYGTTTADGLLALLALGRPLTDEHVQAAQKWLTNHHHDIAVPGFVGEAYQRWPRGLAFYYASASTLAFKALGVRPRSTVVESLRRSQRADGSWANPENLVKEDDPLIATGFAIRALAP